MAAPFSLAARVKSFGYAFAGLRTLLVEQHNARIHSLATALVVALGWYLQVSRLDWLILLLTLRLQILRGSLVMILVRKVLV